MNRLFKLIKLTLLILISTLLMTLAISGCSSDGGSNSYSGKINGQITGVDFDGGTVELIDPDGNIINTTSINSDGEFSISFNDTSVSSDEYLVLKASKDSKSLRALVTGYNGQGDYDGDDTYISIDTESAILLCTMSEYVIVVDYAAFLQGTENGIYDETLPSSLNFPYREVHEEVAFQVTAFLNGTAVSEPSAEDVTTLIEEQNHILTDSIPVSGTSDGLPNTTRAFTVPDGNTRVFITYQSTNSTIDDSTPVVVGSSMNNVDGDFEWNTYTTSVGANLLKACEVRVLESNQNDPRQARTILQDPYSLNVSADSTTNLLTGTFKVASSNVDDLVNYDSSGLVPADNNVNAQFAINFNESISGNIKMNVYFTEVNKTKKTSELAEISSGGGKSFLSEMFSLTDTTHQDKLAVGTITVGGDILVYIEDIVDKTRYLATAPIPFYKTLSDTRVTDTTILANNILTSHDDAVRPVDSGNAYSHYIMNFDAFLKNNSIPAWTNKTYSNNIPADGSRLPLILIHGWEGEDNYRSAAKLNDWNESPVNYFFKLLSYYMGTEELYSKYHVYIAHWPSYKHLTFNGQMFKEILDDVKTNHPTTDLGRGMNDPDVGVSVITHSTGGLIFRSAAQTHKAFKGTTNTAEYDEYALLRKAIILASPNHGTPGAINTFPNNMSLVGKDLLTQSSSDLEWDAFDGYYNIKFGVIRRFDYKDDRSINRYVKQRLNTEKFDQNFLNKIGWAKKTYNPWLMWLNQSFPNTDSFRSKCILYSGWTVLPFVNPGNCIDNGIIFEATAAVFQRLGYNNDSVLPLSSNLLAVDTSKDGFTLERGSGKNHIRSKWYPNSTYYKWDDYNIVVIGAAQDHPLNMEFRLIWDYDHDSIVHGCMLHGSQDQVAALIDQGESAAAGFKDCINSSVRPYYTKAAWEYCYSEKLTDAQAQAKKNPLKIDASFLIMRRDLLNAAN